MSRARVRGSKSRSRRTSVPLAAGELGANATQRLDHSRFVGVSLGGGKTDKTSLAVLEFYPKQGKIFLSRLFDRIKSDEQLSADGHVHRLIEQCPPPLVNVAFDVPLQWPKCIRCTLVCPGFEVCKEPEIIWMWRHAREQRSGKRPRRGFTPYTERCVEQYLQTELEEAFHLSHAVGANMAPLTARSHYLMRRLKNVEFVEVFPKLSLWRIGNMLHLPKSQLRLHRHWEGGEASRRLLLQKMVDRNLTFIYDQDAKVLVDSPQAFDAFLCGLTGLLSHLGRCEPRPPGFPDGESWIQIPKKQFAWP
jgi:Protein of unknown function (DUF429)